jgi:AraC-like DNA-binding protein
MNALSLIVGTVAAVQALLLGAALILRRGASASDRWLGAGFLLLAAAVALITASHAGPQPAWVEAAEVAATLAAAPLAAIWITRVGGRTVPAWGLIAAFLPSVAWLGFALAGAQFASDGDAIRRAVVAQILGSAVASGLAWFDRARYLPDSRRAVVRVLGGLAVLHLAQGIRLVAPTRVSPDLVPTTCGLVLLAVSFVALRAARSPVAALAPATSPETDRLLAAFDRLLVEQRAFLEPRLTVTEAAGRLGAPSSALSRALNQSLGKSFNERLAELRVEEARTLLLDPRLEHLSVEAIGTRAGFGSRSVFFAEFRQRTGKSPAEFRRQPS